jgi:bifunctional DNA-binding transcriptional regulator/antitoxin component of YhaV-PrlF toxin-antitoxin module
MTTVVKTKSPIIVPEALRRRAGIAPGDRLKMNAIRGVITIVAQTRMADGEYAAAERRIIDAGIAEARKGPYYGPFNTADQAIRFLNKEIRTRKLGRRKTT